MDGKPYDPKYQNGLDVRFRTSAGRIAAIGSIEESRGEDSKPRFNSWRGGWEQRRETAVDRGYNIRPFEEYLEQERIKREEKALAKASKRSSQDSLGEVS